LAIIALSNNINWEDKMEIQNITGVGSFPERAQVNNNLVREPETIVSEQNSNQAPIESEHTLDVYA